MEDEKKLLSDPKRPYKIYGHLEKGYEPVLERFIGLFDEGIEKNSQLCVYVKDQKVIDIWGETPGFPDKKFTYSPDSITMMFSNGKTVASVMMAILVDKGLLDYNEKVATYWPEFAQNGKENITVADVLKHEGQLEQLEKPIDPDTNQTENIKKNAQGEIIEKQAAHPLPHGAKRVYHSISRDCITNEIFRRVEPEGRTMGEYFQQVILPEFGIDIHLRMDPETFPKIAKFRDIGFFGSIRNSWKDRDHQYSTVGFCGLCSYMSYFNTCVKEQNKTLGQGNRGYTEPETTGNSYDMEAFQNEKWYTAEVISAMSLGSGRGLAKLAAFMANKGKLGEQ